ncbi:hypothetical protein C8F01DRAFT_1257804 [Mycena amicta]|nr:hypothetical protein C8F01DRAFT_1257804 [Mycena amicta]
MILPVASNSRVWEEVSVEWEEGNAAHPTLPLPQNTPQTVVVLYHPEPFAIVSVSLKTLAVGSASPTASGPPPADPTSPVEPISTNAPSGTDSHPVANTGSISQLSTQILSGSTTIATVSANGTLASSKPVSESGNDSPLPASSSPGSSGSSIAGVSTREPSHVGAIVGSLAAYLVLSGFIIAVTILLRRRRRRDSDARRLEKDNNDGEGGALVDLSAPSEATYPQILSLIPAGVFAREVIESQEELLLKISTARRVGRQGASSNLNSSTTATTGIQAPAVDDILVQQVRAMAERMARMEAELRLTREGDGEFEGPPEYTTG